MRRIPKPTCSGSHTALPGSRRRNSNAVAVLPTPSGPLIQTSMAATLRAGDRVYPARRVGGEWAVQHLPIASRVVRTQKLPEPALGPPRGR